MLVGCWMPLLVGCLTPLLAVLESLDLCRSDEMVGLFDAAMQGEGKAASMSKQLLAKLLPEIAQMLPADSLLGRTVVGHNDMHGTPMSDTTTRHRWLGVPALCHSLGFMHLV